MYVAIPLTAALFRYIYIYIYICPSIFHILSYFEINNVQRRTIVFIVVNQIFLLFY